MYTSFLLYCSAVLSRTQLDEFRDGDIICFQRYMYLYVLDRRAIVLVHSTTNACTPHYVLMIITSFVAERIYYMIDHCSYLLWPTISGMYICTCMCDWTVGVTI